MDELLPYYERELTYLRVLARDFAERYPKVAGRLQLSGDACDDPHVERLIESFAFLAARVHRKLDDDFPEVTDALLQVMYPHYLRPFPAASIAHFDLGSAAAQLGKPMRVPRGTTLATRPVRGVACSFRTAYDLELAPIRIIEASYTGAWVGGATPDSGLAHPALRLGLESAGEAAGASFGQLKRLRLLLHGETSLVAQLREALFSRVLRILVRRPDGGEAALPPAAIMPVGFEDAEALVDQDGRAHPAYRLLLEYFAFPDKFNFVDLELSALQGFLAAPVRALEFAFLLQGGAEGDGATKLLERVDAGNFLLHCTPVVNLFPHAAEPIRIDHTCTSYPLVADSRQPHAFEIHSVDRVTKVQREAGGETQTEYRPFFSLRHGDAGQGPSCYWQLHRTPSGEGRGRPELEISLVDDRAEPADPEAETLSVDLTCTNRDLPAQLPFGRPDGDLFMDGGGLAQAIRFLRKPTASHRLRRGKGAQWRLVSQLSLSQLSLADFGADALREILTLYNIADSGAGRRQIQGVQAVEARSAVVRIDGNPFPGFARGIEVRVTVDESSFVGIGLQLFAQVLDRFFALYVQANSFTRLILVSQQSGRDLVRCPPRSGASILV